MSILKMYRILTALILLYSGTSYSGSLPRIDEHLVDEVFAGAIKSIDFSSNGSASKYKSTLKEAVGKRANFGGRYNLSFIGCGSMCQVFVAVEVETGRVVDIVNSNLGGCFQEDSNLFISNPKLVSAFGGTVPKWAHSKYYKITPNGFELLLETKEEYTGECKYGQ